MYFRIIPFLVIQMAYFILIIVIRPFEEKTNNIVEIVNELMFTVMISMLVYYNKPSRWNSKIKEVFVLMIMSNSASVTFILTISLIIGFATKC